MKGSTVCGSHGGRAPQVRKAAARRIAIAEAERLVIGLGGVLDVDPLDALLESVQEAAWNVAAYRLAIEKLVPVDRDGAVDTFGVAKDSLLQRLVTGYNDERDRLVKYAKVCVDAGVEERKVRLAEAQGGLMARVVEAAVDACNPTGDERAAAVRAAGRELRAIGAGT